MANSQPLIGDDGEFLVPQSLPKNRPRRAWRKYGWLPSLGLGQLLATYSISSLVSVNTSVYGLIMAISGIIFHLTLMIWINLVILPPRLPRKVSKTRGQEPPAKIQIPPGVVTVNSQPLRQYPAWQDWIFGGIIILGIFGVLLALWIAPVLIFNDPIREIYTRGIPLQATLETLCRDEYTGKKDLKRYYRVFFYSTPYDPPEAKEHMGRHYVDSRECYDIAGQAPIYIHYLPEKPEIYRVVAGAYQPYDEKNIEILKIREANSSWLFLVGLALGGAFYAALVAVAIGNSRRTDFIKQHGEMIIGVVNQATNAPIMLYVKGKGYEKSGGLRVNIRYYFYRPDGTIFWNKHSYSISETNDAAPARTGDQIAVLYVDDQHFMLL